ncbi:MAG: hypothetical protein UFG06_13795 [Lachnospiraceae bacterium]|nr:hypothetical protein [Lachnospiraceae bacterium]
MKKDKEYFKEQEKKIYAGDSMALSEYRKNNVSMLLIGISILLFVILLLSIIFSITISLGTDFSIEEIISNFIGIFIGMFILFGILGIIALTYDFLHPALGKTAFMMACVTYFSSYAVYEKTNQIICPILLFLISSYAYYIFTVNYYYRESLMSNLRSQIHLTVDDVLYLKTNLECEKNEKRVTYELIGLSILYIIILLLCF